MTSSARHSLRWLAAALTSSLLLACGLGPQPEIPGGGNSGAPETPNPAGGGRAGASGDNAPPASSAAADAAPGRGPSPPALDVGRDAGRDGASEGSVPVKPSDGDASDDPEDDDASDARGDARTRREAGAGRRPTPSDAAPTDGGDGPGSQRNDLDGGAAEGDAPAADAER